MQDQRVYQVTQGEHEKGNNVNNGASRSRFKSLHEEEEQEKTNEITKNN